MPNQYAPWALTNLADQPTGGGHISINVGGTELIASQFQMEYGVNAIPNATALIVLGRDARTGEKSSVYSAVSALKQMAPVTVTLSGTMKDWDTEGKQWPQGSHTLFIGYVSGITYRRTLGTVSLVLNMVQKMVDLTFSSAGSTDLVPGAPQDLMLPMLAKNAGGEIYGTAGGKFVTSLTTDQSVDFSKGILKVIETLCKDNQLQIHEAWCTGGTPGVAGDKRDNSMALDVINASGLWEGIHNAESVGTDQYSKAYPLDINSAGREHVSSWVGRVVQSNLSSNSIWSMLVGSLLPSFGMALFPTSTKAYLAPWLPMSRQYKKTITPEEYVDFNLSMQSKRPLYGVGVSSSYNFATVEKQGDGKVCVGASFIADSTEGQNDGMWMFVNAPGWMDGWVQFDSNIGAAGGDPSVVAMLSKPSHDATGVDTDAFQAEDSSALADEWNPTLEKYAQMIYAQNSLRNRDGTLVGKLRFDIAPGTHIRVESKGQLSDGVDELATPLIGMVSSVAISINAEKPSANTVFRLSNLRTEEENASPRFSMASHPFFTSGHFEESPLVHTLAADKMS